MKINLRIFLFYMARYKEFPSSRNNLQDQTTIMPSSSTDPSYCQLGFYEYFMPCLHEDNAYLPADKEEFLLNCLFFPKSHEDLFGIQEKSMFFNCADLKSRRKSLTQMKRHKMKIY